MFNTKLKSFASVILVSMIPATLPALEPAQGNGQGNQDKNKSDKAKNEQKENRQDQRDVDDAVLTLSAGISISYKEARQFAVESDLTGYKPLPPGIRKNLARGKPIPPGIAKTRLPSSFLNNLPAREGYEWQVAGTDLLLVFNADKLISNVLKDVFK